VAVAVVRRADGSGTTFIFTNYLGKVSAEWKQKVGEGTAVQWPLGLGGKGTGVENSAVLALVRGPSSAAPLNAAKADSKASDSVATPGASTSL
jgi:ABC-type phosphate transport system substrate-binding protein